MSVSNTPNTAVNTIFNLIKDHGSISQSKMSELSGYSRAMISIACEKMLNHKLIVTDNTKTNNKKKNIEYKLNLSLGYIIGIAIGGTSSRIGIFNLLGEPIEIIKKSIDLMRGPDPILLDISQSIDVLKEKYCKASKILGIGMGIPTPVKYEEGYANYPAFMPGWHMFNLKKYFSEKYNCPAFIDNEVNTMALEEFQQRKNKDSNVLLCIKVGTGIGAGLVINNKIYRGENGGGGNIGHIQVEHSEELCECGKRGCIEAIASAPAVLRKAEKAAQENPDSLLALYSKTKKLEIKDIKLAADNGDRIALDIIQKAGENIGQIIGTLNMFLDPGFVVIAGQLTQLGPNYLYYMRNEAYKRSAPWIVHELCMDVSKLTFNSAVCGAARLCIGELFESNELINKAMNDF